MIARTPLRIRLSVWLLLGTLFAAPAWAKESGEPQRVHTVQAGQRLGSIAKRYRVTLEALQSANGLAKGERIRTGQRLVIPGRDDPDGSLARTWTPPERGAETATTAASTRRDKSDRELTDKDALDRDEHDRELEDAPRTHRVSAGQRLESIAKRYRVSVGALCTLNGLKRRDRLQPGQVLSIPNPETVNAKSYVGTLEMGTKGWSRRRSAQEPLRKGQVELLTYTARYRGLAVDKKGHVPSAAQGDISRLLGATGTRPRIEPRLIRLLAKVSDKFNGRPIRVVSGYRTRSFYHDSRHRQSRAVDFSVLGISNAALRDYLRTLHDVGVGYYPNSSFVHLDVRDHAAYWVDYAGPGERPRSNSRDAEAEGDLQDPEVMAGEGATNPESSSPSALDGSDLSPSVVAPAPADPTIYPTPSAPPFQAPNALPSSSPPATDTPAR
jgi:LysM repeat protein